MPRTLYVIFDIPDRLPLPLVQFTVLNDYAVTITLESALGFEKTSPRMTAGFYSSFSLNHHLEFISIRTATSNYTPYENIKIFTDRRPPQRDILHSQNFTTASQFGKISVAPDAPFLNRKPPVQGIPEGLNSDPTVVAANKLPFACDRLHHLTFSAVLCSLSITGIYMQAVTAERSSKASLLNNPHK